LRRCRAHLGDVKNEVEDPQRRFAHAGRHFVPSTGAPRV
jgi:hypothetical protein